jgi:hypothetical protein
MKRTVKKVLGFPKRSVIDLLIFLKHRPKANDAHPVELSREINELRSRGVTKLGFSFESVVDRLREKYILPVVSG